MTFANNVDTVGMAGCAAVWMWCVLSWPTTCCPSLLHLPADSLQHQMFRRDLLQIERRQPFLPRDEFGTTSQLLAAMGRGYDPIAVMLGCSELGDAPYQLSCANPEEVTMVHNAGGVVSPAPMQDPFLESVVEGSKLPTVRHLIVCGHTGCTALAFLIVEDPDTPLREPMHSVRKRCYGNTNYVDLPMKGKLNILIQESVLQQLTNLRSHPDIQSQLRRHELLLHGWIRDDETSAIAAYDPATGQFC